MTREPLPQPADASADPEGASRPWTPAAAMEPVLPLAPPPARPRVSQSALPADHPDGAGRHARTLLILLSLVAVVVLVVVLVLHR